ncbi:MAG: hypothetical protein LM583_03175, partial [Desulfurococcaceae archaeon]|nr:hypothetical protein [Desulfurococcaceae archaeon]
MCSAITSVVVESLVSKVLEEAMARVSKKVAQGKKLTDSEIAILLLDQVLKRVNATDRRIDDLKLYVDNRFEDIKVYIDKRFDDISKRFDDLRSYIDRRFDDLKNYVDKRFDDFKSYVDAKFESVEKRVSSV